MSSNPWDVYLDGNLVDTVWFDEDCEDDYVYRALVEHDGYDSNIVVLLAL